MGAERRKDYMVNQRVHLLYMVTLVTSVLLVVASVGTVYTLSRLAQRQPVELVLGLNAIWVVGGLVSVIVISSLTLGVYTMLHTHRMLGSAYHISLHLNKINAGTAPPALTLRESDYFKEVADEINVLQPRLAAGPKGGEGAPPA